MGNASSVHAELKPQGTRTNISCSDYYVVQQISQLFSFRHILLELRAKSDVVVISSFLSKLRKLRQLKTFRSY